MPTYVIRAEVTLVLEKVQDYDSYQDAVKDQEFLKTVDVEYLQGRMSKKIQQVHITIPTISGATK